MFQDLVELIVFLLFLVQMIEEPQREEQEHNGNTYGHQHPVELGGSGFQLTGTSLQLAILSGVSHQVDIDITVGITLCLVIHRRIGHTQLFTDTRHQVGCLVDDGIGECLFQIEKCGLVIANLTETRGQRTIGTCNLIDIAILHEERKCTLSQPAREHLLLYPFRINKLHGREIVVDQLPTIVLVHQMLRESLQRLGGKIGHPCPTGCQKTAHEGIELLLVDVLLSALGDDATCSDIIEVVQILGCVTLYLVRVDLFQCLDGLTLQSHIIIIGGVDDGIFRLGIAQDTLIAFGKQVTLLVNTT